MITRDEAQPGVLVRDYRAPNELLFIVGWNGVENVVDCRYETRPTGPTLSRHIQNLILEPQGEPESMADALDSTRDALAHRLELYDEDATLPVKAVDLQILLDGLNVARAGPVAAGRNVSPQGLEFERDQAVYRLREANYALNAIRQLAESWRFIPGPNRPTDEEATEDRVAQLILQVLGKP